LISFKEGYVEEITKRDAAISWIRVDVNGVKEKAVNYNKLTGDVEVGDQVTLNTTAVDLSLGTGGVHFVIHNHRIKNKDLVGEGHIMKLRYTPMQLKCLVAEEESSPYYEKMKTFNSLNNSLYVVGTLHSMVAPIAAMLKWLKPKLRINYIMTDAGALPIEFSLSVKELKEKGIINKTITTGHSFGGDIESINIYTGIIASKEVLQSDVTIIAMGPGIVGTGTKYGFSGIEQGHIIDAVNNLGGVSFALPRISFSDKRDRHWGISHHTITSLEQITNTRTNLVLPQLDTEKMERFQDQISNSTIASKHNVFYEDGKDIIKALEHYNIKVSTMGRGYYQDEEYFISLGAAARGIINYLEYHQ